MLHQRQILSTPLVGGGVSDTQRGIRFGIVRVTVRPNQDGVAVPAGREVLRAIDVESLLFVSVDRIRGIARQGPDASCRPQTSNGPAAAGLAVGHLLAADATTHHATAAPPCRRSDRQTRCSPLGRRPLRTCHRSRFPSFHRQPFRRRLRSPLPCPWLIAGRRGGTTGRSPGCSAFGLPVVPPVGVVVPPVGVPVVPPVGCRSSRRSDCRSSRRSDCRWSRRSDCRSSRRSDCRSFRRSDCRSSRRSDCRSSHPLRHYRQRRRNRCSQNRTRQSTRQDRSRYPIVVSESWSILFG